MDLQYLDDVSKLTLKLADYINTQQKELDGIRSALVTYQESLTESIKRLRDE
jgi:hypothetical protein